MPNRTLLQLCQKIEAGYAAGMTIHDPGMVEVAQELCNRTSEIADIVAARTTSQMPVAQLPKPIDLEMGFRPKMLECLLNVAKNHGDDSEPDHEVGDLQDLLRPMWAGLTPQQQRAYLASEAVATMISGAGAWNADGDKDLVLLTVATVNELEATEWGRACEKFGLDTSFVYPDESIVEIINAYRCDHLRDEPEVEVLPHTGVRQL